MAMLREDVVGLRFEVENDPARLLANEMGRMLAALKPFQEQMSQGFGNLFQNVQWELPKGMYLPALDLELFENSLNDAKNILSQGMSFFEGVLGTGLKTSITLPPFGLEFLRVSLVQAKELFAQAQVLSGNFQSRFSLQSFVLPGLNLDVFRNSLWQAQALLLQFQTLSTVPFALFRQDLLQTEFQVQKMVAVVGSQFLQMAQTILSTMQSVQLGEIGSQIMQGLLMGILSQKNAIFSAVSSIAQGIKSTISSAMRIASPSKEMAELGRFIGLGLPLGFRMALPEIERGALQMQDSASAPLREQAVQVQANLPSSAPAALHKSQITQQHIAPRFSLHLQTASTANERELEQKVREWVRKSFEEVLSVGSASTRWEV